MKKAVANSKVTTVAAGTVQPKGISSDIAKKNGEKQAETASDVDLRQPKDRDPTDSIQNAYVDLLAVMKPLFSNGLFSSELVSIGMELSFEFSIGNELFEHWLDTHTEMWNQPCDRFDAPYDDFDGMNTVESKVELLFQQLGEWEHVLHLLTTCFDVESAESHDSDFFWSVRCLAIRVSQQNPFSFFDVDALETTQPSAHKTLYFDNLYEPGNPRLRHERPLARFWIMCSALFHHPWACDLDDYLDYTESDIISVFATRELGKIKATTNSTTSATTTKNGPHIKKIYDPDSACEDDSDSEEDSIKGVIVRNSTSQYDNGFGNDEMDDDEDEDDDDDDDVEIQVVKNKLKNGTGGANNGHQAIKKWNEDEGDEDEVIEEFDDDEEEDDVDEEEAEPPEKRAKSVAAADPPEFDPATWPDLPAAEPRTAVYSTTADTIMEERALSVAEKIERLRQVNIDGMTCNCTIFEIAMGMNWTGAQAGADTLPTTWVKHVLVTLAEALNNSTDGLIILPINDDEYKNKNLWVNNEQDLRRHITTYRDLSKYIDLNYGNAAWAANNVKPGEKKLRTRVRVGYNIAVESIHIQHYLHVGLQSQGRGTGCYDSPLQFGEIEKIGGLCFYPPEMNSADMEKELMREFQWSIPLGLRTEWVNMPYNGRMKWNEREPGIMLWHVYVPKKYAKKVDAVLRKWLNPLTAKKHLPFAASVHYISDWKAAQAGKISVKAYGPIKEQIITMVSKARDFQDLTVVLFSDLDHGIHGMLKKVMTRQFGESSLLKLMLSIKATPIQADIATNAAPFDKDNPPEGTTQDGGTASPANNTQSSPPDTGESGTTKQDKVKVDSDDDDNGNNPKSFKVVQSKRKKAQKKKVPDSDQEESGMSAAQQKAAEKADRKRQQDLDNNRPSPLFLMILPGEMAGSYIFVCRRKFEILAKNVLTGLVAFLTHHLMELTTQQNDRVLAKWISRTTIESTRRKNLQWCAKELRARELTQIERDVEQALEFLDDVVEDPMEAWEGTLEILTSMADYNDIDDGATVAGALDELNEKESQLADALTEISIKETELHEANRQHMAERLARQHLEQKLKVLEAAAAATTALGDQAKARTYSVATTAKDRVESLLQPDPNPQVTPDRQAHGRSASFLSDKPASKPPPSNSREVTFKPDGSPSPRPPPAKTPPSANIRAKKKKKNRRRSATTTNMAASDTGTIGSRPITQFFKQCGQSQGDRRVLDSADGT